MKNISVLIFLFTVGCSLFFSCNSDSSIDVSNPDNFDKKILFRDLPLDVQKEFLQLSQKNDQWNSMLNLDESIQIIEMKCLSQRDASGCYFLYNGNRVYIRLGNFIVFEDLLYKTFDYRVFQETPKNSIFYQYDLSKNR